MNNFYVYFLRRPDKEDPFEPNQEQPFYVGKGCNERYLFHRAEAKYLFSKPGRKSYKITIIHKLWKQGLDFKEDIVFDNLTEREAFELEIEAIAAYGRIDLGTGCLTNLTDGGEGNFGLSEEIKQKIGRANKIALKGRSTGPKSEETKKKLSVAMKGRKHSEEARKKMSESSKGNKAWNKGLKMSDIARKNMSKAQRGRKLSEEHKRKISDKNRGKKLSEETKQKLREARLGKKLSPEHIEKLRQSHIGKKASEETKRKMSEAHKGKSKTDEHRKNLSKAKLGNTASEQAKQNMSKAHIGVPWSEARREAEKKKKERARGDIPSSG